MMIDDILNSGPVIPVIVIENVEYAVPLAKALVEGGIPILEVTLRTACALEAVKRIASEVPDAIVGVGTVTRPPDLDHALKAGAQFGVSPGASRTLLQAVHRSGLPFLPGSMTPSDVLRNREEGFTRMKLFPAVQAGGVGMLKALGSVYHDVMFCPTGGIDAHSANDYLALPNVACVGGSWLAPPALVKERNWAAITQRAQQARGLDRC